VKVLEHAKEKQKLEFRLTFNSNELLNKYLVQLILVEVLQQDNTTNLESHVLLHMLVKVFKKEKKFSENRIRNSTVCKRVPV